MSKTRSTCSQWPHFSTGVWTERRFDHKRRERQVAEITVAVSALLAKAFREEFCFAAVANPMVKKDPQVFPSKDFMIFLWQKATEGLQSLPAII